MKLKSILFSISIFYFFIGAVNSQSTKLLRQPSMSQDLIAFTHGGDIWTCDHDGLNVTRITSTPAVESNPHFSPNGEWIAFSSNRSGSNAVYIVSSRGGTPKRLTWHPASAIVRGWNPGGTKILYASSRDSAPTGINRLWTVAPGGGPSTMLFKQWGFDGSFSPDGKKIALDKMSRWESEFRAYRGGQNTPLIILDLATKEETLIPHKGSTDIQPLWLGNKIYFLSDRDWTSNVWSYDTTNKTLEQITRFDGSDVKWLAKANQNELIIERDGQLHLVSIRTGSFETYHISVIGDFPWAETKWEDVSQRVRSVSLSPTGKRALMEARGEIFTIPVEHGDPRNLTQTSTAADRNPLWSPKGDKIAWFSDMDGKQYALYLAEQDGLSEPQMIPIGNSKMAWEPTWSPDGKYIAFTDDDVRVQVINIESRELVTADTGGINLERGSMGLSWSPDSKHLAYAKTGSNNFRKIMSWSVDDQSIKQLTNSFADSFAPAWDRDKKHLYFLASTNLALGSGWANTSAIQADPRYAAYVIVLKEGEKSPFIPKSDEEEIKEEKNKDQRDKNNENEKEMKDEDSMNDKNPEAEKKDSSNNEELIVVDVEKIERRTIALPIPTGNYGTTMAGSSGSVFISERKPNSRGLVINKFTLKDQKSNEYATGVRQFAISADGKNMLIQNPQGWQVSGTGGKKANGDKTFSVNLKMKLNRQQEWKQIFEEAWRYERDYFYDPDMHGRDWDAVYARYEPLMQHIRHRSDLSYVLDQVNGEMSVGHSFVFGGDFPSVDRSIVGLLGADLMADNGHWRIDRIYTTESWNPNLTSPLDRPGLNVKIGNYIVGINGKELSSTIDPYEFLDGTMGQQTVIHINDKPEFKGSWKEIIEPIRSENSLRQRAWVEDNRRKVDSLSNGKLAYIWVPNTGGNGFVSFNRYYFAQQDKEGAIIDERFNGGGSLDDYMVDLMTRKLRAAITNEVPGGKAFKLPAGILGPKALLINEMAGSGGDFFPWVFKQQKAGPLIGATTWGGLVKSSVHYALVDGGALTAPDNAVFDPIKKEWIAENKGVSPNIEVRQDSKSLENGSDPQLERAVIEVLRMLIENPPIEVVPPPYSKPAKSGN